jgi:Spy/CpxP family protein refolding chaperone
MSKTRKRMAIVLSTLSLAASLVVVPTSLANPSPPTNGGNGAGHSGQCTGNPADRPAVCPAT